MVCGQALIFLRSSPRARLASRVSRLSSRARLAFASVPQTRKRITPLLQAICRLKLSLALLPLLVCTRGGRLIEPPLGLSLC